MTYSTINFTGMLVEQPELFTTRVCDIPILLYTANAAKFGYATYFLTARAGLVTHSICVTEEEVEFSQKSNREESGAQELRVT